MSTSARATKCDACRRTCALRPPCNPDAVAALSAVAFVPKPVPPRDVPAPIGLRAPYRPKPQPPAQPKPKRPYRIQRAKLPLGAFARGYKPSPVEIAEMARRNGHAHHWLLDELRLDAPTEGRCRDCGETRTFEVAR